MPPVIPSCWFSKSTVAPAAMLFWWNCLNVAELLTVWTSRSVALPESLHTIKDLISSSYWLAFTLRSCAELFGGNHRDYFIRKWYGHFDNYDIWINYSYKGNYNPVHHHSGFLSGIIYYSNQDNTIFTENNFQYRGEKGDMLLFPSTTPHQVNVQEKDYERVTFAFNINRSNEWSYNHYS